MTNKYERDLIQAYMNGGSSRRIAIDFEVDGTTLRRQVTRAGVEVKPRGRPPIVPSKRTLAMTMAANGIPISRIAKPTGLNLNEFSLYKIQHRTRNDEVGLRAVGTIIESPDGKSILVHREKYADPRYEKFQGSKSIQLSWRGPGETDYQALLRMIQSEVYGVDGGIIERWQLPLIIKPKDLIGDEVIPYANILLADVGLTMYRFEMTEKGMMIPFGSEKVADIHWAEREEITDQISKFRWGAREALLKYWKMRYLRDTRITSDLNTLVKQL